MGSELRQDDEVVWGRIPNAVGSLSHLALPTTGSPLEATNVIEKIVAPLHRSFYRSLFELLESFGIAADRILRFPYDWRQDNRSSAARLKSFLADARSQLSDGERFTILGHSMGGLVARYCVQVLGADDLVDRIITLGTPNRGSLDALEALIAGPKLFRADPFRRARRKTLRTFPSVYQLLPQKLPTGELWVRDDAVPPSAIDLLAALGAGGGLDPALVHDAWAFHSELASATVNVDVFSIYGHKQRTLASAVFEWTGRRAPGLQVKFGKNKERGDDRVLDASGRFDPDRSRTSTQHHARIWMDSHVTYALSDLLCGVPPIAGALPTPGAGPPASRPGLILDVERPFLHPGEPVRALVGLADAEGVLAMDQPLRVVLKDEDGEERAESTVAPRDLTDATALIRQEFEGPDHEGIYALEVSALEQDGIDPVEDYLLVQSLEGVE